ncbi:hypothetical protein K435DRAFT_724126 [Dendrothele bispora CBS 962.96]|uniref:Uncharacterized protein n=1 Tax=Dendrothele bispora (strain CBS 962.96) TaxID=1314807 RepID=A0A4V4HFH3_DENBC|nr:hypothetical protein K435DRAFT_724126 [Dendrothele bispora CBS 962.96]
MAQAVFDDHPLEQYLRDAGEAAELMPGGSSEFIVDAQEGLFDDSGSSDDGDYAEACPTFLKPIFDVIFSMLSMNYSSAFVERFKYSVISSSLLSSSLAPPHTHNLRAYSPQPPGKLPSSHSRDSSVDQSSQSDSHSLQPVHSLSSETPYYLFFLALSIVTVFFGAGHYFFSVTLFVASAFLLYIYNLDVSSKQDMTPSLDTLNDLISAGDVWDSVVQEAIATLEKDEHSSYNSSSPSIPSHSLRVTLHSTLLTTQNQCDNVRHLLSALTSQNELSQLSEMYAPPSPLSSKGSFPTSPNNNTRPFSLPTLSSSRQRTSSAPTSMENKRMTWNGSYSSLANAGSPTQQFTRRREKRRSDLSALLQATGSPLRNLSVSAPVSPAALEGVAETEEDNGEFQAPKETNYEESFGAAALDIHRKRRSGGLETLGLPSSPPQPPPPSSGHQLELSSTYTSHRHSMFILPSRSPVSPRFPRGFQQQQQQQQQPSPPSSSSSRFTPLQAPRHPLSLSALHLALQGALSSKRYACSHLLALRFNEEKDDESYWEDVRSVMGLLTTTFVDASARLTEALEEMEQIKLRDQCPSPFVVGPEDESEVEAEGRVGDLGNKVRKAKSMEEMMMMGMGMSDSTFAPMPSQLTRFAAHVDVISAALNDARMQLEECVEELRKGLELGGGEREKRSGRRRKRMSRLSALSEELGHEEEEEEDKEEEEHPSIQAYERLRRELGLALRECERGRERLLDIVYPPRRQGDESPSDDDDDDERSSSPLHDLPALGHDIGSDESSDKPDSGYPIEYEDHASNSNSVKVVNGPGPLLDDATSHLLLTSTSRHLPPQGIEQVFEAESGSGVGWKRERSKLTREERIKLVKMKRESQGMVLGSGVGLGIEDGVGETVEGEGRNGEGVRERWGPGGEVVQELKDVIWQVGERRRKMQKRMSREGTEEGAAAVVIPSVSLEQTREEAAPLDDHSSSRQSLGVTVDL